MRVRALRQAGLAVVPMVLLSQCAPQCAPAPSAPPTVAYRDVTESVPPDMFTSDISNDGRFIGYGGLDGGAWRLDFQTGQTASTDGGILIGDGWGVVDYFSDTSAALYDFVSGTALARAEVLAGWEIVSIDSASRDGYRIGVTAATAAGADVAALLLDLRTGAAIRLDSRIPGAGLSSTASYGALVSADGSRTAFSYRDAAVGCSACVDAWEAQNGDAQVNGLIGPTTIVSATAGNGPSNTGDSEPVDISADGRFVLFHSTATDVAGGSGQASFDGQLIVRDIDSATAWAVPGLTAMGDPFSSAVSDDGTKVAYPTTRDSGAGGPRPFAALYDRSSGSVTVLTPTDLDHQLWSTSWLAMSGNGTRVALDVTTNTGVVHHAVVDVTY